MRNLVSAAVVAAMVISYSSIALAADQPHMEETLRALEHARHEIEIADAAHDHGGHAGAATSLIDQAIAEVREGIHYRNEHGR
jgi:hypothetical protein